MPYRILRVCLRKVFDFCGLGESLRIYRLEESLRKERNDFRGPTTSENLKP